MKSIKVSVALVLLLSLVMGLAAPALAQSADSWVCLTCGKENHGGNYCGYCGAAKPVWTCVCGAVNTTRFCVMCGRSYDEVVTANTGANDDFSGQTIDAQPFTQVGGYVLFGRYEQDNNLNNGAEDIEWLVLDYDAAGNKALLISRYGLDVQYYNSPRAEVTWETCTLRSWLNADFLNTAFNAAEQGAILTTNVDNSSSQCYSSYSQNGGRNTQDKIFLLSYGEANRYLNVRHWSLSGAQNNVAGRTSPTAYAKSKDAITDSSAKTAENAAGTKWWMRSPGANQNEGSYVDTDGALLSGYVNRTGVVIRPVFWLDLTNGLFGDSAAVKTTPVVDDVAPVDLATDAQPFTQVGGYVLFGRYEQDNNLNNGMEEIEWLVLDYDAAGNKALLLSRYGLDVQYYNTPRAEVTWETCYLRAWLNGYFYSTAFSAAEQSAILTTNVDNSSSQCYSNYSQNGGKNTQDKIFLLSYGEANRYLNVRHWSLSGAESNVAARTSPTAYAKSKDAITDSSAKTAENAAGTKWWMRSPGDNQDEGSYVDTDGALLSGYVNRSGVVIRPVCWIDLTSGYFGNEAADDVVVVSVVTTPDDTASVKTEDKGLEGVWRLVDAQGEGVGDDFLQGMELIQTLGGSVLLTLDGSQLTLTISIFGTEETESVAYSVVGSEIYVGGNPTSFIVDGDTLTLSEGSASLIFTRQNDL